METQETKTTTKPAISSEPRVKASVTYPIIKKEEVKIFRKQVDPILPEVDMETNTAEDYMLYIGSVFAGYGSTTLLGRTIFDYADDPFAEEKRIMSSIINIGSTDPKFEEKVQEYWANFRVFVPYSGLKLEVGKYYESENVWRPINPAEYILYLYALKSYQVANNYSLVSKSKRIDFYIWTPEEDRKRRMAQLDAADKAFAMRKSIESNLDTMNAVLRLNYKETFKDEIDARVAIAEFANTNPVAFYETASDKKLLEKDFVRRAVMAGAVIQPAHSTVIMFDGDVIGQNLEQAAAWINDPLNGAAKATIIAKMNK